MINLLNKFRSFFAAIYLLVILITLYVTTFTAGIISDYTDDLIHYDAFQKISCERLYFGRKKPGDKSENWYCQLNARQTFPINFPGAFFLKNAEFEVNLVWYNTLTNRVYKYSQEDLYNQIVNGIIKKLITCFVWVLLCVVGLSMTINYNEKKQSTI